MELLLIIAVILILVGIVGSVIPAVPGPGLSFVGLVLLYFGKPGSVPVAVLVVFGLVMVGLILLDYIAPLLGAKLSGATKRGVRGGLLGMLVGLILFPPLGAFVGAFLGAFLGEAMSGKTPDQAVKAGIGTFVGSVGNIVLQTVYSLVLAVYFVIKLIG